MTALVPVSQVSRQEPASLRAVTPPASRPMAAIPELLEVLVERGASDLHLTVGDRPRIRLDGELEELADLDPPSGELLERLLREITPDRQQASFDEINDAFRAMQEGEVIRSVIDY